MTECLHCTWGHFIVFLLSLIKLMVVFVLPVRDTAQLYFLLWLIVLITECFLWDVLALSIPFCCHWSHWSVFALYVTQLSFACCLECHGWDFSGYSWFSGFRYLSESCKNGLRCIFSVIFHLSEFRLEPSPTHGLCWWQSLCCIRHHTAGLALVTNSIGYRRVCVLLLASLHHACCFDHIDHSVLQLVTELWFTTRFCVTCICLHACCYDQFHWLLHAAHDNTQ